MKKTLTLLTFFLSLFFLPNNINAQSKEIMPEGFFDNNLLVGGVIAVLIAILYMRFREAKKEKK